MNSQSIVNVNVLWIIIIIIIIMMMMMMMMMMINMTTILKANYRVISMSLSNLKFLLYDDVMCNWFIGRFVSTREYPHYFFVWAYSMASVNYLSLSLSLFLSLLFPLIIMATLQCDYSLSIPLSVPLSLLPI